MWQLALAGLSLEHLRALCKWRRLRYGGTPHELLARLQRVLPAAAEAGIPRGALTDLQVACTAADIAYPLFMTPGQQRAALRALEAPVTAQDAANALASLE